MLNNNRTANKSSRKRGGRRGSPYHAAVQAYPVFRIGGRRSRAKSSPATAQAAGRTSAYQTNAKPRRKARPVNLIVQLRAWIEDVQHRSQPKNRRSRARLGHPKRQMPNLHAAVIAPVRSAWQAGGNTALNILFLALVGWALFWFFTNEQFYVHEIAVTGNWRVSGDAIVAASKLQDYSIFWLNARQAAQQIVEALPPVRAARVEYGLPNAVTIIVEEQGGQVMWQSAGMNYWVDDDGRLHPVQGDAIPSVIVQDIRPGLPDSVDPQAVLAAQQLVELLPDVEVLGYAPATGLRFQNERGWEVYLGTGEDMARKISILHAIERQFAGQDTLQPSLVDLRFPDSPYYRLPDENGA